MRRHRTRIKKSSFVIMPYDLSRMVKEMIQNNIGVAEVETHGKKLDLNFWDELEI